ncbi:MAG: hypothetical protein AB8B53_07385 [Flavobacteriales bacterium]
MKTGIQIVFLVSLFLNSLHANSQDLTVYLIPGMGTDQRIMAGFDFGENVKHVLVEWPENAMEHEGLKGLARSIATQIDTTQKFILLGVSMGGMLSMELTQIVNPEAVILVSSVKSSKELPFKYKLGRVIPLHLLLTEKRLIKKAENEKTWREIESEELRNLYADMLKKCGSRFLKWQMSSIVNWKFKDQKVPCEIFHIHGDYDKVLPMRKTSANRVISGATHKLIANGRDVIQMEVRKFISSEKFN